MGTPYYNDPGVANAAAIVTIPASSDICQEIEMIGFSYNGTPTGGSVQIESPSGTVLQKYYITSSGPGPVPLSGSCLKGASGQAIVVRLAAGGAGVSGLINVIAR